MMMIINKNVLKCFRWEKLNIYKISMYTIYRHITYCLKKFRTPTRNISPIHYVMQIVWTLAWSPFGGEQSARYGVLATPGKII